MKKTSRIDTYLDELGWIISNPALFDALKRNDRFEIIIQRRFINKESRKEVTAVLDVSLDRLRQLEVEALANLKATVSTAILSVKQLESVKEEIKAWKQELQERPSTQIPMGTKLSYISGIDIRLLRTLNMYKIHTLADVLQYSKDDLLKLRGMGTIAVGRLSGALAEIGIATDWD